MDINQFIFFVEPVHILQNTYFPNDGWPENIYKTCWFFCQPFFTLT